MGTILMLFCGYTPVWSSETLCAARPSCDCVDRPSGGETLPFHLEVWLRYPLGTGGYTLSDETPSMAPFAESTVELDRLLDVSLL